MLYTKYKWNIKFKIFVNLSAIKNHNRMLISYKEILFLATQPKIQTSTDPFKRCLRIGC